MKNAFGKLGHKIELWPLYALCIVCSGLLCIGKAGYVFPVFMMIMIILFMQMILSNNLSVRDLYATLGVMAYPLSPILLTVYISLREEICAAVFLNGILPAILSDTFALFGGRQSA